MLHQLWQSHYLFVELLGLLIRYNPVNKLKSEFFFCTYGSEKNESLGGGSIYKVLFTA